MKKTISIILAVCAVSVGITVAASFLNENNQDMTDGQTASLYTVYDKAPVFAAQLSESAENAVFEKLNRSGKDEAGVYQDIFTYLRFKEMYAPSEQDMQYIDSLILAGADIYKIIDIYDFWLTTSEPISIIGQIYNLCPGMPGAYWIEDAFNQVTQNRHGVLNGEAISAYLSERTGAEGIRIANILSRRGVLTITQLLDRYAAGEEWPALAQYVETNAAVANGRQSALQPTQIETAADLLAAIRFACTMPQTSTVMALAQENENADNTNVMLETMSEQSDQINAKIYAQLLEAGIFVRDDSDAENARANAALKQRAAENGISEAKIEALLDEGYRLIDILNASEECKRDESKNVEAILETERAEMMTKMEVAQ